jgi:hypothetical protein
MNRIDLSIILSSIFFLGCNTSKKDDTRGLDGKYFYSESSNLSYYIPKEFNDAYVETEIQFDSLTATINHEELKESLKLFYYTDVYSPPGTLSSYYFYKEDSINYTYLVINETEHIRLNDKNMEYFTAYRNSIINNKSGDSIISIELTDDKFTNKSHHQIMTTRGITTKKNDSTFWEYFLVSQFLKTYSIFTKSNTEFNFKPFIHIVRHGDKTAIE